jgi:hypothetical protein
MDTVCGTNGQQKDHSQLCANQKQLWLVVFDGDTTMTGEQMRVKQAAKVSVVLPVRIGI